MFKPSVTRPGSFLYDPVRDESVSPGPFKRFLDSSLLRSALSLSALLLALLGVQLTGVATAQESSRPSPSTPTSSQPNAQSGDAQEATTLELEKPIEREFSGGQKHVYRIALQEGQFFKIEVKQKGIDVGVDIQLPNGEVDNIFQPFGNQQDLNFTWMSESPGIYRTIIYASAKAPAGHYEIRLAELRPATENDRELQQARNLFAEYARLERESRYLEARVPLTRAFEIREKVLGPDHPFVAETLAFLANNYDDTGDYARSEPMRLRALQIKEKAYGKDDLRVALAVSQLAAFYMEKGDSQKAEELDRRALGIYEKAQMSDKPAVGAILANLGNIYYERGDYLNASKYYEQSRAVWEKLLGADHFHLAPSYMHLGRAAYDAGDYARAEMMFQHALALNEKGVGPDNTSNTKYLNNLAMLFCTTGDYTKGESLYRRAVSIQEQSGAMGQAGANESLFGLSRCLAAEGKTEEAIKFQTRASDLEEFYTALNLAVGSEREKLALLNGFSLRFSRNVSLHTRLAPDDAAALKLAVTTILRRKGRAQDAMSASLSALRQRSGPEDQKLLDRLNNVTERLANLVLNVPQKVSTSDRLEQIKSLEEEREGLEANISQHSAGFYERSQPVTLDRIQSLIPKDAALLEFAVYRPFDPKARDNSRAYGAPRYVVYVLRSEGQVRWQELGDAADIEKAVDQLRRALRDPQRRDAQVVARAVDERVMRPVRALLGDGVTQLLISPDGELNLIPFAALMDEQGHYLIERYACTYLTSGRDLLRLQVVRESRGQPLIVANPLFGMPDTEQLANATRRAVAPGGKRRSVTNARDLSEVYFAPLNGTAQEASSIQKLFPEAHLLSGPQATKAAVAQAIAPRILHIATHGFFLEDAVESPAQNSPTSTRQASVSAASENPLLRSGLALAGANLRAQGKDDGILTALEATGLNLWGTKLVVLSACDTGLGEVRNGEGVYGLRRAFVLAGAESLVMSLWPASDYVTRELMTDYYKNLKQGLGRGDSLRRAQLDMLRRDPHLHPFYWANFIQSGEWANLSGQR